MTISQSTKVTYSRKDDDVLTDTIESTFATTLAQLVRQDLTIAQALVETDFLPVGITQVDYLLVRAIDFPVLLRTIVVGTQYTIPAGGVFLVFFTVAGVNAVLFTGNGANDAKVQMVIGQI